MRRVQLTINCICPKCPSLFFILGRFIARWVFYVGCFALKSSLIQEVGLKKRRKNGQNSVGHKPSEGDFFRNNTSPNMYIFTSFVYK